MEEQRKKRLGGFVLILVASLLNGIIPSFTQKALALGLPLETILTSRYLMGALLIWMYIFIKGKKYKVGRSNIAYMLALGFMLFICTSSLGESYKYLPGAVAVIIVFSYVSIVVFIEILVGRENIEKEEGLLFALVSDRPWNRYLASR